MPLTLRPTDLSGGSPIPRREGFERRQRRGGATLTVARLKFVVGLMQKFSLWL
jgi:hypothetical protein